MSGIHYLHRVLVMLLAALPLSLIFMTTIWGVASPPAARMSWFERLSTLALFLSVAGVVAGTLLSVFHSWMLVRGLVTRPLSIVASAAIMGALSGLILSLALPRDALPSMVSWGLVLGLLYAVAIMILPAPEGR
jgi:hypothetical protein